MDTVVLGPPVFFPSNSSLFGLSEDDPANLRPFDEMTQRELDDILNACHGESPNSSRCGYGSSDLGQSPDRHSLVQSIAGASSRSPGTTSLILTPSSGSLLEYHGDAAPLIDDLEASESMATAPGTTQATSEEYVHIGQPNSSQGLNSLAAEYPIGSGARLSPAYYSRQPPASAVISAYQAVNVPFDTAASSDNWVEQPQSHNQAGIAQFGNLQVPVAGSFNEDEVIAHADPFATSVYDLGSYSAAGVLAFNSLVPFRTDGVNPWQDISQSSFHALNASTERPNLPDSVRYHQSTGLAPIQQPQRNLSAGRASAQIQHDNPELQSQLFDLNASGGRDASSTSAQVGTAAHQPSVSRNRLTVPPRPPSVRRIEPRRSGPSQTVAHAQGERKAKGGRSKNMRLAQAARDKSSAMRQTGACWGCALQRDSCPDGGTPCGRCLDKARKGRIMYFPCDRSKLTEWRHEFLPTSFTYIHQKQTLLDAMGKEVARWDRDNGIDVYLTSAYGPALRWKLYEFMPSNRQHLIQYQYLQDVTTRLVHRYEKYSPPFALMKLDESDEHHFETYLDRLMHPGFLWDLGWVFYEEENQINDFLPRLVEMMCNLYQQTSDAELHHILHRIIRLMIITYIMGHTLTISEDTLYGVFDSIRHSQKPRDVARHTSPRLATQQLKVFFSVIRDRVFAHILNWAQQTLHSSKEKTETWLPAFCVMLGLAMVLEEIQRTIHIQADTAIRKGEKTDEAAVTETINACGRIDERFSLLIALYQCKYRDRKWNDNGSFGPSTPKLVESCQDNFLGQLHMMLREKSDYLHGRKDVPLHQDNHAKYTARLVARFLLPFLNLP